ncbi:GAF and ANTAR domain-containing protein [Dactylosporangium matsuzakiense]|uniref:GAF domain-containing protein n=1 Tax=Dactylosporangium matsuzakiense TaxID=53360 RepID=A0A9W6KND1_9ACTN|nr:GAF and ANTAR domain-containing protein [Dactylosporangium matsuzakiense]GLL03395.1 GAF domain-containing protein [Dactylosporangium matsuzakiense]
MAEGLERICVDTASALSASGACVSVITDDGVHGMSVSSDAEAARIEELQFTFGEGPCIDAFATGRPVLVPDLAEHAVKRWPVYGPAAQHLGVSAVFAFPLQVGAARLGVLDVFRGRPGPLSRAELGHAFMMAEQAVLALLDGQERAGKRERSTAEWGEAFEHRAELFQAQGMVMVQLGISLTDALARIRAHTYATNRSLREVAADIVARRLRFDADNI